MLCACQESTSIQSGSSAAVVSPTTGGACPGQYDQPVTSNYYGHSPSDYMGHGPLDATKAVAAEWVYQRTYYCRPPPCPGIAAIAWVNKGSNTISAKFWDAWYKQFTWSQDFALQSARGWIQPMGWDQGCAVFGGGQCAWFAVQDFIEADVVIFLVIHHQGYASAAYGWFYGADPSGEHATVNGVQRKLVAYIAQNRTQIRAKIYDAQMVELDDKLVWAVASPALAYQTATAWQPNDGKWLVAWTERKTTSPVQVRAMQKTVHWNWNEPTPDPPGNGTLPCDFSFECSGAAAGETAPLSGPCICKPLWLGSSRFSATTADRYRMLTYGTPDMARLDNNGVLVATSGVPQPVWSPVVELNRVSTPNGTATYQRLVGQYYPDNYTNLEYLVESDVYNVLQSRVLTGRAEAFRAEPGQAHRVALGVAADKDKFDTAATLRLSAVPMQDPSADCPP